MIEFGKTLREAREAKGLSVAQVADQTHIMHQIVEGLESEDFSRIVAPIYGRGFVKLYCECVGLEAKPYVDEFMEIYNGNRPAAIRTRAIPTAAETPAPAEPPAPCEAPAQVSPAATEKAEAATDLFGEPLDKPEVPPRRASFAMPAPEPQPAPVSEPILARDDEPAPLPPQDAPHRASPSRFAAPLDEERPPVFRRDFVGEIGRRLPPNIWRILTLVFAAIAVILLAVWGIRAVYRAATEVPAPAAVKTTTATPAAAPAPVQTPAQANPRKPVAVPALYID